MKKIFVLLAITMFVATSALAFNLPGDRTCIPSTDEYRVIGTKMVNQKLKRGGTITMTGYQKGSTQIITLVFKDETRPYCWWKASTKTGASEGRCDVDNDGTYEYDFGVETGRTGRNLYFKPAWPTAYD